MVQVDIFWSYAIGAGFSLAAYRQLQQLGSGVSVNRAKTAKRVADKSARNRIISKPNPFENAYFIKSLLYLALLFAPSGIYLLWAFPSWETMHVFADKAAIPAWLVVIFAITNVTQGILGYWVTYKLTTLKKHYAAFLQPFIGYFLMFFILVNGWDNKGYQRFLSATGEDFLRWDWSVGLSWLKSDVALTLGVMGIIIIPVMLYWLSTWTKEGYTIGENVDQERAARMSPLKLTALLLLMVFGVCLGFAVLAAFLINVLGWWLGLLAFAVVFYMFGLSKIGFFYFAHKIQHLEKAAGKNPSPVKKSSGKKADAHKKG
jgi:hypothetical protein